MTANRHEPRHAAPAITLYKPSYRICGHRHRKPNRRALAWLLVKS